MDRILGGEAEPRQAEVADENVEMGHVARPAVQANPNPPQSASARFVKQNRFELIKMGAFATLVLINLVALPDIKIGCKFESTTFNAVFLYLCLIPETVLRIIWRFFAVTDFDEDMSRR